MARMKLAAAHEILNQARASGWCVRPSLHSDKVWIAELGTYPTSRRLYGAGVTGLAQLLQTRGSRSPRPPRSDRSQGGVGDKP